LIELAAAMTRLRASLRGNFDRAYAENTADNEISVRIRDGSVADYRWLRRLRD
jgi:hypothetical protein